MTEALSITSAPRLNTLHRMIQLSFHLNGGLHKLSNVNS